MQLNLENSPGLVIRSYSRGELLLGETRFTRPLIVTATSVHSDWTPGEIPALSIADFEPALRHDPEVILFGTGPAQHFPPITLISDIMRRGVGFEVMDTAAACRTFNVLMSESRRVVAALLLD